MTIKSFGKISEIIPSNYTMEESFQDVAALKLFLETTFPALAGKTYLIAVNQQIAHPGDSIPAQAEIALLPPFSGG
jgi:molybdopterin synthase sulfur carrier subunit